MAQVIDFLNSILWSKPLVLLCLAAGLFFSFKTKFLQVRHFKEMIKLMLNQKTSESGVSSFQALALSVAGRVGTGNIAGVATAIALGGPGAVFWMWIVAFLGAATSFIECTLAQIYKVKVNGELRGGPAYYFTKGLGQKWYGILFAVSLVISYGLLITGIQSNTIVATVNNAFGISPIVITIAVCVPLGIVIFGGLKRIANVAQFIVPIMAIIYILVAIIIVVINIRELPGVIALIVKSAFGAEQAFSGILGSAISWGVRRGIYSNEAGQGTAPHAAAPADVSHPAKQGLVQAFSVYIDTLFVCSATAFMILITSKYNVQDAAGGFIVNHIGDVEIGAIYTQLAIESVFKGVGSAFVAIALFFFAFTTLMYVSYVAETNIVFIFGSNKKFITAIRIIILASTFYGGIASAGLIWSIADVGVGIITWQNIIGILILAKPALLALKDYEQQKSQGLDPTFNPVKLGIKNATFWENDKN